MTRNIKWLCIMAGAIALLAILPSWPYVYYVFLRWILFVISLILALKFFKSKLNGWAQVSLAIGIVFNPIFPVYMNKSYWVGIDFVTGLFFLLASQSYKAKI